MSTTETATFTATDVVTGMCLWEAFLALTNDVEDTGEASDDAERERADELLSDNGSFTVRNALVRLIAPCMDGWRKVTEHKPDGAMEFDWEWCPQFVRTAIQNGSLKAEIAAEYERS